MLLYIFKLIKKKKTFRALLKSNRKIENKLIITNFWISHNIRTRVTLIWLIRYFIYQMSCLLRRSLMKMKLSHPRIIRKWMIWMIQKTLYCRKDFHFYTRQTYNRHSQACCRSSKLNFHILSFKIRKLNEIMFPLVIL